MRASPPLTLRLASLGPDPRTGERAVDVDGIGSGSDVRSRRSPRALLALVAGIALAAAARAEVCAQCRIDGPKTLLCAPHAEVETNLLARPSTGASAERIARLREIAALSRSHENARSPRAAKAIAKALEDPDREVRLEAVQLLSPEQHSRIARESLADALRRTLKAAGEKRKEIDKLVRAQPARGDGTVEGLKKVLDTAKQQAVLLEALVADLRDVAVIARALARHACQGSMQDVLRALDHLSSDEPFVSAELCEAALSFDNDAAVTAAIRAFASWESELAKRREPSEAASANLREVHEALARYASSRGLTSAPPWSDKASKAWIDWLATNRRSLARAVPDCGSLGPAN